MKKIFVITIIFVLSVVCSGCGSPSVANDKQDSSVNSSNSNDMINGYKHAEFNIYNSPAEENGLGGDKVYIKGNIESVRDNDDNLLITIATEEENGIWGSWTTLFEDGIYSEKLYDLLMGEDVTCFGEYIGFSERMNMPAIKLDKIVTENDVIDDSYFKNNTTTTVEETTVEEKETNIKVYSDKNIEISYIGTGDNYGIYPIFKIKNKSDDLYSFFAETITINGITYNDVLMVGEVSAKSETEVECKVEKWEYEDINTIGLHMYYNVDSLNSDYTEVIVNNIEKNKNRQPLYMGGFSYACIL